MNSPLPPTTSTLSYFDALSNEWVTTFTIRHKVKSEDAKTQAWNCIMQSAANTSLSISDLTHPNLKLPTFNQKNPGLFH